MIEDAQQSWKTRAILLNVHSQGMDSRLGVFSTLAERVRRGNITGIELLTLCRKLTARQLTNIHWSAYIEVDSLFRHRLRGCAREFQMMYPLLWSYHLSM
jgi:hypothetical protein